MWAVAAGTTCRGLQFVNDWSLLASNSPLLWWWWWYRWILRTILTHKLFSYFMRLWLLKVALEPWWICLIVKVCNLFCCMKKRSNDKITRSKTKQCYYFDLCNADRVLAWPNEWHNANREWARLVHDTETLLRHPFFQYLHLCYKPQSTLNKTKQPQLA